MENMGNGEQIVSTAPELVKASQLEPQRLGADSDWSEIFSTDDRAFFRKTNGQCGFIRVSDDDTKLSLITMSSSAAFRIWTGKIGQSASLALQIRPRFRGSVGKDGTFAYRHVAIITNNQSSQ